MVFKSLSMYLFSLVIATNVFAIMADYDPDKLYTIRPAYPRYGELALDTSQKQVLLQDYGQRREYELFYIRYSHHYPGLFHIVTEFSREFLDVDASVHPHAVVITAPKNSWSRSQLWGLKDDGRIINAHHGLALSVANSNFEKGNPIVVYHDYGHDNQIFNIREENLLADN